MDFQQQKPRVMTTVSDRIKDPSNPKRFHYRMEGMSIMPPKEDGKESDLNYIHADLEATLKDTTVEVGVTNCDVDESGIGTFSFLLNAVEDPEALVTAEILIAECTDGTVLYGQLDADTQLPPVDPTTGSLSVQVDTNFVDEFAKMFMSFETFAMQHYAGPTPIDSAKNLQFAQKLNADPAAFYNDMTEKYQRVPTKAPAAVKRLRRLASCDDDLEGTTGTLDCSAQSDTVNVFNCDTVSTDSNNPGCSDYTNPAIALIDEAEFSYGGTDFIVSVTCVDCAATVGGAAVWSYIDAGSTSADFSFGGEVNDAVIDFALLLELSMNPSYGSSPEAETLLDQFIPGLGGSTSAFGVSLGAGLKMVATVEPDLDLTGSITVQAGSKLVLNGAVALTGSAGLSGVDTSDSGAEFTFDNIMDTPAITATLEGEFEQIFTFELQAGLWASIEGAGSGEFYGAAGVPLVFSGHVAGDSTGLLTSIPSSYCSTDKTDTTFFVGDCTQPNNLQVQMSIETLDPFLKAVAQISTGIGSIGDEYYFAQDAIANAGLTLGPYTVTYCDCLLYDGIDCSVEGGGSQCNSWPPVEQRAAPAYNADSPSSGMDKQWSDSGLNGAADAGLAAGALLLSVALSWFTGRR